MSLSIQTSFASLVTQNSLTDANDKLTTAMTRLSTGYQVNSSADDAAGLSIATRLQSTSDGIDVANDNIEDASSMLSTADSSLDTMTDIASRMKDLATQAANGTYSDDDIKAMQTEYDSLTEELKDIVDNTEFGGQNLLSPSTASDPGLLNDVTFQVGASADETLEVNLTTELTAIGTSLGGIATGSTSGNLVTDASTTITDMEDFISNISDARSALGAKMNQLDYTAENITSIQENTDAAVGNIMDADYASETAEMSKQELLEQAGISVLSSVSQMQSMITNLLG